MKGQKGYALAQAIHFDGCRHWSAYGVCCGAGVNWLTSGHSWRN